MADEAARRREIRRKRILENAEERKKKIFGQNTTLESEEQLLNTNDTLQNGSVEVSAEENISSPETEQSRVEQNQEQPQQSQRTSEELGPRNRIPSPQANNLHTTSMEQQDFLANILSQTSGTTDNNGVLPQLEPLMRLLNSQASNDLSTSNFEQEAQEANVTSAVSGGVPLKSHPFVPVMLGIAVCGLLSANLGYVVQHSIGIPFLLWEAQTLWCSRAVIQHSARNTGGLLSMALMLCGLKQKTIAAYFQAYIIMKTLFGDFCLYILTVVIWYHCLGLPGALPLPPSTPILNPQVQAQMNYVPPQDPEAFDIMEDF